MDEDKRLAIKAWARHKAFLGAISPILKLKIDILNTAIPQILIYSDGTTARIYPDKIETKMAECNKIIAEIAEIFKREVEVEE